MKKNEIICPRCGTSYQISLNQVFKGVKCPHCQKKMMVDSKTKKRLRIVRYLVVLIICMITMFVINKALSHSEAFALLMVAIVAAVMYLFAQIADKACGFILYHTIGLTYEEYIEKDKVKKK